jgi:hypothetical protein
MSKIVEKKITASKGENIAKEVTWIRENITEDFAISLTYCEAWDPSTGDEKIETIYILRRENGLLSKELELDLDSPLLIDDELTFSFEFSSKEDAIRFKLSN